MSTAFRSSLALCLLASFARAQEVTLVSVDPAGVQGDAPSSAPSVSADGRFVAFQSDATNLLPGDSNGVTDVFVRDRVTGTTTHVTVSSLGQIAIFGGSVPSISANGRFVAFESDSPDLVVNDMNGWPDVFVHDLVSLTTERVSISTSGTEGNNVSRAASISADGRYVAFESRAATLVPGDTNFTYDVFVHDRVTQTTERVSVDSAGIQGNSISRAPSISGDGRYVAFESFASNLVPNDTNGLADVFVHDRQTGTTTRISLSSGGVEGDLQSINPSFARNGRFVAFESEATNLVSGDTNGHFDVFVRDLMNATTVRGSVDSLGNARSGDSFQPALSADGRMLVFASYAALESDDTNSEEDIWVRDLLLGQTTLASVSFGNQTVQLTSSYPAISDDGMLVAFTSLDPNLVPNDTNGGEDVFAATWPRPYESVCLGDGSGSACPCSNESAVGARSGCRHSLGDAGHLFAHGTASVSSDTLSLDGSSMPDSSALYFQGTISLGLGTSFGDGLRCAGGTIARLGTKTNTGGASRYPGAGDTSVSVRGACTAGASRVYQVWYRNAAPFCTPATFNLTNGLRLSWLP
jgi:Tol biopolymer transport system component